ncbi:MAG: zinc transport system ATP-binding protein [Chlamydiales bacterium]|jgi:zinc transport system ATP-binding protein
MQNELLVHAENLSFQYGKTPILEGINLKVEKGQFVGIIGPNGGGKTTLLKLILGFLKPTKGSIKVLGESPKAARKKMSYVPQALHRDKEFPISVIDVVLGGKLSEYSWFSGYSKDAITQAYSLLERLELKDLAHSPFGNLSGGQAQKTLIARALISEPEILLLDEPTSSVDAKSEKEIHEILRSLQGQMSILMVTHDIRAIIDNTKNILSVHRKVVTMKPADVCEHFALGVYHTPLIQNSNSET